MDLSIVIATLSLLVSVLTEVKSAWMAHHRRPIGISLLQLILILDKIIETGDTLVASFANIRLSNKGELDLDWDQKKTLLTSISHQYRNLRAFAEICDTPLNLLDSRKRVSVSSAIKFMLADQTIVEFGSEKDAYLRALTWKLLENETFFNRVRIASRFGLHAFVESILINDQLETPSVQIPTNMVIKEKAYTEGLRGGFKAAEYKDYDLESKVMIEYNLNKTSDVRRMLEGASNQLYQLRELRERLAQFTIESFSLNELLPT